MEDATLSVGDGEVADMFKAYPRVSLFSVLAK